MQLNNHLVIWLLNVGNSFVEQLAVSDMLCEDIVTETFGQIITEDVLLRSVLLEPLNDQEPHHVIVMKQMMKVSCFAFNPNSWQKSTLLECH